MGIIAKIIDRFLDNYDDIVAKCMKKPQDISGKIKAIKKQAEQEILAEVERCNFPYNVYSPPKFDTKKEEKAFQRGYMIHWQITKRNIDELKGKE